MIRSKIRRRIILLLLLWVILFFSFVLLYISERGGEDYTKDLASLIPGDSVLYITINDLDEVIKRVALSTYVQRWIENGAVDLVLEKNKRWEKWQKKKKKYAFLLPYDSEIEFVNRWMGKQVVGAIVYAEGSTRPGIIVATRTKIGFEEKLATFVLEHYPELGLQKEKYKGKQIVIYKGKKEKRGFCYTLFGRTVVLSLRSPSPVYIRKIIDTYYAGEEHSLSGVKRFKKALGNIETERKILCYADVQRLPELFTAFRKKIRNKDIKRREVAAALTKNYDYGTLILSLDKTSLRLEMRFFPNNAYKRTIPATSPDFSKITRVINMMPVDKDRSLVWFVSQLNADLLQAIVKLSTKEKEEARKSREISRIMKPFYTSGTTSGSMSIGFFLQAQFEGALQQYPVFSGVVAELPAKSSNIDELTSA
ncbi:hypothetical protein J7M23_01635, partial [Candidatus Sumerlaeota bacterium]|nr:hypothetical protein [Candidatus Sumerlaeota bacterium]